MPLTASPARAQMPDKRIAEALKPLPEDLKAGATVVAYDKATGARQVLKQGTNQIECQPKAEDGFVRGSNKVMAPRRDMEAKLHAQEQTDEVVTTFSRGERGERRGEWARIPHLTLRSLRALR